MQPSNNLQNMPNEANVTSQNIMPTTNTANNKKPFYICLCFAIIATIIAVIFACLYFLNLDNVKHQSPADSSDTNDSQQESDTSGAINEETAISDVNIISDLDRKMLILHRTNYPEAQRFEKSIFIINSLGYETPLYEKGTLSDIAKLTHLIDSMPENSFHTLSEAEKQSIQAEFSDFNPQYMTAGIDADIIGTKYKALYGNDIVHGVLNDNNTYCPQYNYNKEHHVYYNASSGCGGKWDAARQYYKYKYTTDDNHAYVYVAAGAIVLSESGEELMVCDVVELNKAQLCGDAPEKYFYDATPFISSSNYQNFTNYRFVFNKADDDTYYFSKVEKL